MLKWMQHYRLYFRAVLSLLLVLGAPPKAFAGCDKPLIFGWANWAPYHFKNTLNQNVGVSFDVMDKITEAIGCDYKSEKYPWKRLFFLMENDQIDVLAGIHPSIERAKFAFFSKPYGDKYIALFVRIGESNKFPFTSLKAISDYNFSLGVRDNVDYGAEFTRMLNNPKFSAKLQWLAIESNPLKLVAKRIDGLLMDPLAASSVFRKQGVYEQIEKHPMPFLKAGELSLMLNKKMLTHS